jgi:hypothetical protein
VTACFKHERKDVASVDEIVEVVHIRTAPSPATACVAESCHIKIDHGVLTDFAGALVPGPPAVTHARTPGRGAVGHLPS